VANSRSGARGSRVSDRTSQFTESVIREMTRLCHHYQGTRGINLAQGFPDFPAPDALKEAACAAIREDVNQYSITWGSRAFREAIAAKTLRFRGIEIDPEREITVCCGATEAMASTLLALVNPGDEVIVFQPFYENYWPDSVLAGATPRFVTLHEPDWRLDESELASAFNSRTRAIIINTPNNPTGKVFTRAELEFIGDLCQKWNVIAVTDEIYEHLVYEGEHVAMATLPGMRDLTVTISGLSKTYSVTGWRVGYTIAPPDLTDGIRKVHDFLTVGAPAPLQAAGVHALGLPDSYYAELVSAYRERRDICLTMLEEAGFACHRPAGAYYVMADIRPLGFDDDVAFAHHLVRDVGLAVVPGSSFYREPEAGRTKVRFVFAKRRETLARAAELLKTVASPRR
jgi:L-glutamine---4-(methylsulfanyl)-2-oxobutanoate aminotransferase